MPTLRRYLSYIVSGLSRWWRRLAGDRLPVSPGQWTQGEHSSWKGRLLLAPWLNPTRRYRLYLPQGYDRYERLPLVVMLHGCRQDPQSFAAGTRMNALADEHRFLVLYPQQGQTYNRHRCWNWFDWASQRGYGEAAIIVSLIKRIRKSYAVDRRRIYAAGLSAGGAMVSILAVHYPRLFAAVAIHSGLAQGAAHSPQSAFRAMRSGGQTPVWSNQPRHPFVRTRSLPAVVFHGCDDQVVDSVNAKQIIAQFVGDRAPQLSTRETPVQGYAYRIEDYYIEDRLMLRAYFVAGLGHAWSGGDDAYEYHDTRGPDASGLIWDFFRTAS